MESKLVSVIIPTYNRADYLNQAIESVLSQTYTHFELLILDNCSVDNTPAIVSKFTDSRIKYIRHQCNIHSCANWAYGIYWASGEYLCVLGDDDKYTPSFLSARVDAFNKNENIAAVFSNYDICDADGLIQGTNPLVFDNELVLSGEKLVKCAVNGWFIGATLYKRAIVQELFDKSVMAGKALDTLLNVNIAISKNKVVWIKSKGLIYRWHENQDTVRNTDLVLICHIAACTFPLMFDECIGYRKLLAKSSISALTILGFGAWTKRKHTMARRFVKMELIVNYLQIKTWIRLFRYSIPIHRHKTS